MKSIPRYSLLGCKVNPPGRVKMNPPPGVNLNPKQTISRHGLTLVWVNPNAPSGGKRLAAVRKTA